MWGQVPWQGTSSTMVPKQQHPPSFLRNWEIIYPSHCKTDEWTQWSRVFLLPQESQKWCFVTFGFFLCLPQPAFWHMSSFPRPKFFPKICSTHEPYIVVKGMSSSQEPGDGVGCLEGTHWTWLTWFLCQRCPNNQHMDILLLSVRVLSKSIGWGVWTWQSCDHCYTLSP